MKHAGMTFAAFAIAGAIKAGWAEYRDRTLAAFPEEEQAHQASEIRRKGVILFVSLAGIGLVIAALSGCAPQLQEGNAAGGTIRIGWDMSQKQAFALADAECRKGGKVARSKGVNEVYYTLRYDCVAP